MRAFVALFVLVTLATASLAAEIRKGAAMQVKADTIWFEEAAQLTRWQAARKGNAEAFAAYQKKVLSEREAWQFVNEQPVVVLGYEPRKKRVKVEMKNEGRLKDSKWFVDPSAIQQ